MTSNDDRPGYDAWKLATPPEYDAPDEEPGDEEHPFRAALDDFIESFCNDIGADSDTLIGAMEDKIAEIRAIDRKLEGL